MVGMTPCPAYFATRSWRMPSDAKKTALSSGPLAGFALALTGAAHGREQQDEQREQEDRAERRIDGVTEHLRDGLHGRGRTGSRLGDGHRTGRTPTRRRPLRYRVVIAPDHHRRSVMRAADDELAGASWQPRVIVGKRPVAWSGASIRTSTRARPSRARPARRRDRPARSVAVHRAGGQRQDHDARRPRRLADRDGDAARRDPGDHLQQAGRGRDDRAARCGRGAARGRARRRPRPDVPRAGARDPARRRRRRSSRSPTGAAVLAEVAPWADEADLLRLDTVDLAAQGRARRRRRPTSRPTPRPVRSRARSSPTRPPSRRRGGLDFDDLDPSVRSPGSRAIRRCSRAGAAGAASSWSTRSRTSTGPSSAWPCCWPRRPTGSSSSATTTSRSTAGGWPTSGGSWASRRSCRACAGSTSRSTTAARGPVVERAVRLVEHNGERFAKPIRAGPAADGPAGPGARRRRRDGPPRAGHPVVARRRDDPGGPRPDEPRAAARRSWSRSSSACRSARRGSTCCSSRRSSTRSSAGRRGRRRRPVDAPAAGRARAGPRPACATTRGPRSSRRRSSAGRPPFETSAAFVAAIDATRAAPRRPPPRRRPADAGDRARDQGPRVRPRRRRRHGGRPLPERAGRRPRPRTRSGRTRRNAGSPTSRGPGPGAR